MAAIKFVQDAGKGVEPFTKDFNSFEDVRNWVLHDKEHEYGDVLAYGGTFEGLTEEQVTELANLTLEDALKK